MEAKELRLGNLVRYELAEGDKMRIITIFTLSDVQDAPNYFYGIPLTKEWLIAFGLTVSGLSTYVHEKKNVKVFNFSSFYIRESTESYFEVYTTYGEWADEVDITTIEYVHQLQNLYFALTGEELTIK